MCSPATDRCEAPPPPRCLSPEPQVALPGSVTRLAALDLRGSGAADLVATLEDRDGRGQVAWLKAEPGRGFAPPQTAECGPGPAAFAAADLSGDGLLDVAVVNRAAAQVTVLPQAQGGAGFQPPRRTALPTAEGDTCQAPTSLRAGLLNKDQDPDLVVACERSLRVLLGKGDGTFLEGQALALQAEDLLLADLNNDGRPDLLAAGQDLRLFLGTGAGAFATPPAVLQAGADLRLLHGVDLDGDGDLDLLTLGKDGAVRRLLGQNDGTFSQPQGEAPLRPAEPSPGAALATADLNRDGRLDLLLLTEGALWVYLRDGAGYHEAQRLASPGGRALALPDLQGDGRPDVAVAVGAALHLYRNTCEGLR